MPATPICQVNPTARAELARLHARLCPRQVLGLRIGQYAGELLDLSVPRSDKRVIATVEVTGCFADGVSVASGCWLGRGTLRVVDYGKVGATFFDLRTQAAVRIWPAADARTRAQQFAPTAPDCWHAQLEAYKVMPAIELLNWSRVALRDELVSQFTAEPRRVICGGCGEEILYEANVLREGLVLCRACNGEAYYSSIGRNADNAREWARR